MLVRRNASYSPRPSVRCQECASLFDRLPAGGSDPEANDLDRLGASLHGLVFCSSKPGAYEAGDHVAIEPMGAHK
jgi:hypothetical protein